MRKHYDSMVFDADARVDRSLQIQFLSDETSCFYGGFYDASSLIEAKFAIYRVTTMITEYLNPDSRHYLSSNVLERVLYGLDFIARTQRENGFFDLNDCNFYSGPDTAFCLKRLIPVFCYLKRIEKGIKEGPSSAYVHSFNSPLLKKAVSDLSGCKTVSELTGRIECIIRKGADAISHGGFHTPNHRWAIASVLAFCARIFDQPSYKEAADKYLAEGLDCNSDGEWAERSAGNYNRINNDAMIMLAVATGDDSYYEPVIRNLKMMLTYIEPDGSVFTNNSTRQDRGKKTYPKDYYFEYLYMGARFNIPEFLDAANYIMELVKAKGLTHMDSVISYLNNPELIDFEHAESAIPKKYANFYRESNIVRARNNGHSYSIINNCPSFLYFQSGSFSCGFKIGASFCEHRAFTGQEITETKADGKVSYHLHEKKVGWYYLPLGKKGDTTDWWKMDNASRQKLLGPDMIFDIDITPIEDGIELTIKTSGIDKAPIRLEMSFDADCRIDSDYFMAEGIPGGGMIAKEGTILVSKGEDAISVGPCFGNHSFTAGKFGSAGRDPKCFTVYLTDETCFTHTLTIKSAKSAY